MKVLLDRSSLEVFGNDGEKVISTMMYPDKDATGLALFSEGEAVVKSLKMWDLSGGYECFRELHIHLIVHRHTSRMLAVFQVGVTPALNLDQRGQGW